MAQRTDTVALTLGLSLQLEISLCIALTNAAGKQMLGLLPPSAVRPRQLSNSAWFCRIGPWFTLKDTSDPTGVSCLSNAIDPPPKVAGMSPVHRCMRGEQMFVCFLQRR